MRDELYDLMRVYEPDFQYRWNEVIHDGFNAFAREVATLLPEGDLVQETGDRRVYWRDGEGRIHDEGIVECSRGHHRGTGDGMGGTEWRSKLGTLWGWREGPAI